MNGKQPKRINRLIPAGAVLAALAASILIFLIITGAKGQRLLLVNELSGEVIFSAPLRNGERFSVLYTHSVNKSPVSEHYEIRSGQIFLTELRYRAFGAGMPTQPEEGQSVRYEDGDIVIYGFEREMTRLCYNIGRIAGHTLRLEDREIRLDTLDKPGSPILFTIENSKAR